LRAPLIHISGFAELLLTDVQSLDDTAKHYLQTIVNSTERMGRMIYELLAFSRTSRAELHKVRVSMVEIVRSVLGDLAPEMKNRNVIWVLEELPDVQGDPFLLRQALCNLLANALKYTRKRDEARIAVGAVHRDRETVFFIRDKGVGFDMEYANKLFGVFQRLHSASEFEGTGIGLANVRSIIKRHGGRTWAEATVNVGATFYFSLPDAAEASPPNDSGSTNSAGRG
jgi:light-regulated signal transduction histidine kinase (bacteriophytochrome)